MHVRKPIRSNGCWKIIISESVSPTSKIIETFECDTYVNAFQTYRQIMKELGIWI